MAAAESRASLPADSIDFVNENNSGGAALCGVEKITHTACTDADVKFDEFGTADGEEGDFGFTGNRFCKQCFACARRADKKHTFGNSCTHFGESFRIAQKIDNLAQLLFFFIGSGNIFKRDIVSEFIRRLCAALAEIHALLVVCTIHKENKCQKHSADDKIGEKHKYPADLRGRIKLTIETVVKHGDIVCNQTGIRVLARDQAGHFLLEGFGRLNRHAEIIGFTLFELFKFFAEIFAAFRFPVRHIQAVKSFLRDLNGSDF